MHIIRCLHRLQHQIRRPTRSSVTFATNMSSMLADHPDSIRNDTDSKTMTRCVMVSMKDSDLTILLNAIQTACKLISRSVRKAGIANLYGSAGSENATGDSQKKLDVLSNDMMVNALYNSNVCAVLVSEENEEPIFVPENLAGMTIHFMGFYAWWFSQHKNAAFTEYIPDYWYYMQVLRQQKPWGHIAPLRDCAFNQGKSNIAGLESVYAGAVPIVPNWVEWDFPAALKYNNPEEFSHQLQILCEMSKDEHKERWTANMAWIKENRVLSVVNKKRMELLCR